MPKSRGPSSAGAAWARLQVRNVRPCETCARWGKANPAGLKFADDAWEERARGARVSRMALWKYLVAQFAYPYTASALRCHQEHGKRA